MSTLSELAERHTTLSAEDIEWLHLLHAEGQLTADLALADIVLWLPTVEGTFVAAALFRPSSANTLFYRDIVGTAIPPEWVMLVSECVRRGVIVDTTEPIWFEESATKIRAVPVRRGDSSSLVPIAVLTRHINLAEARQQTSRQATTFVSSAEELFNMISEGAFPDSGAPAGPKLGAPRASDGLMRLDVDGVVQFASPNALSALHRFGYINEIEGASLTTIAETVLGYLHSTDESLPLITAGRAPWRTDIETGGATMTIRSIPLKRLGERFGAIILIRDVTELRRFERELITKDATIREIHHRVKNNLQTVASLLRIQARRAHSTEAKDSLTQAMRRVEAIAVVHDTLASGLAQTVDFDEVASRVTQLAAEVAQTSGATVRPSLHGEFGMLPSEFATPLAVVLTELVTNAVEHGLVGVEDGAVVVTAERGPNLLRVTVSDNGKGLAEGTVGQGLGTQIVRTLVENELSGGIDWHTLPGSGAEVTIDIPLKYMERKSQ